MSNDDFGTATYNGTSYALTQQAYVTNHPTGGICYEAQAAGPDGKTYVVRWLTTDEWDARDMDLPCDESDACDWDNPVAVWCIS